MEPLDFADLPKDALVLVDSAPIIYFLEGHPKFRPRFKPIFEAHGTGHLRFAVTTITIAEVLTGPLQAADDALARRYPAVRAPDHETHRRRRGAARQAASAGLRGRHPCQHHGRVSAGAGLRDYFGGASRQLLSRRC